MGETAEALAANLSSRRNVTIEISNLTSQYFLANPTVFLESGHTHSPPQPTVRTMKTEVCNFTKTSGKASGAVGVLTYDLLQTYGGGGAEKVAMMFSVPHDYNAYKNWLAVGILPRETECNEALYKEMYYGKEQRDFVRVETNGSGITYEGRSVDIKATMSPVGRAIMKVEVWDKLFRSTKT